MLNLDTHILIYALQGSLTRKEHKILSSDTWSISGIVLWEISKFVQLGRVEMNLADPEVIRALSRVHTWPLTFEICRGIHDLDFSSDPA
ncbi:MAG TPA: PIN domain-containing protein, partial [Thermoanaerobaculia bacterium]